MVKCLRCDWVGDEDDLKFILEDEDDLESGLNGCPNCLTDSYLVDGWIKCGNCNKPFRGMEGKEDICQDCLKLIVKDEMEGGLKND